jgi:wobble nucleotide-excising tRNase
MLRKIVSIKNVGRFLNSAATGNPELARHTFVVGANGFGKTTICAILRSLKSGLPAPIVGRKRLGVALPISVELLTQGGLNRFGGAGWTAPFPNLAIFDGEFIAENVHSGEVVDIEHRRNLYRIIVGEEGVRLVEREAQLAGSSRELTTQITASTRLVQPNVPAGMTIDDFIAVAVDPGIDVRIEEQERAVSAAQAAAQIGARPQLQVLNAPSLPEGFLDLLSRTIEDVAADAEVRIANHLAQHGMVADGQNWLATGTRHADRTCPFCGQGLEGLELIQAYRSLFSEGYRELQAAVQDMGARIEAAFGERAIGQLRTAAEQNRTNAEFWSRYCPIDQNAVDLPLEVTEEMRALSVEASALLRRKAGALLERIALEDAFRGAAERYEAAQALAAATARAVDLANAMIEQKRREAGAVNLATAQADLAMCRATRARHQEPLAAQCLEHARLKAEKNRVDGEKETTRRELDEHAATVMRPYQDRINGYLDNFNAGFRIAETQHGYPGGKAASSYQLVINDTAVALGDEGTPADQPSFKNTLSSGDRTTLALAFFLADLERDQNLAQKVVVFDDPFNSQDAFRRRQTVFEIAKIAGRCAQVIVLSHDAMFLKLLWDKAPPAQRVALTLADHRAQGSKIIPIDLERASQGRTATDIDDLQAFLVTGAGERLDIIRKMRGVLETYCWTTYPNSFAAGQDWLGEICRKIREGGEQHSAAALYDELDQINEYTSQYYHGENMNDAQPDNIDPVELTGFVRRALKIVNALQA